MEHGLNKKGKSMDHEKLKQLRETVKKYNQEHVFRFWNELTETSQNNLINQLEAIDFDLMVELKKKYIDKSETRLFKGELEPPSIISLPHTDKQKQQAEQAKKAGEKLLTSGKVAALLVAGGQGTRLGFKGPKGMFPAGPISGKSLFQLHAEKIMALNRKYNITIAWYIMTSETNFNETVEYFKKNNYFGLAPDDVFFFVQGMIPAMDKSGYFFLDAKDHIFVNPNGHGGTLFALRDNGCIEDMSRRGIEEIFYFQVDNVLIKICDPYFIGYHHLAEAEMSAKVVSKKDPLEKVGIIGKLDGKITVIEYSDLPDEDKKARLPNGELKYRAGSIAIHTIKRKFIERLMQERIQLPYHVAHKKIPYIDENGNKIEPDAPNGYKFEMFIFDALPHAKNSIIMEIDRKNEFSPIKNATGSNSQATAKQALMNYHGRMLQQAGFEVQFDKQGNLIGELEISPLFALDADELKNKLDPNFKFDGKLLLQ